MSTYLALVASYFLSHGSRPTMELIVSNASIFQVKDGAFHPLPVSKVLKKDGQLFHLANIS